MLPPRNFALTCTIWCSLHSMLKRDSFTRGGFTSSLGAAVSPETTNSSTSGGYSPEQRFIFSAKSSLTMFTTNSRVASILTSVSFLGRSPPRIMGQKQITGGFALITVKKLNGARLRTPSGLSVDTNAIGRGRTAPESSRYTSNGSLPAGSMIMDFAIIAAGPDDPVPADELNLWQRWLRRPQSVWLRRALFQIHLWTGIGTGLYVLMISLTGSAIVFRNEIYKAAGSGARVVEVRGAKLPAEELKRIIRQKYPENTISFVFEGKRPDTVTEVWMERRGERIQHIFDPYSGADLGDSVPRAIRISAWLARLHTDLLYGETGRKVNG